MHHPWQLPTYRQLFLAGVLSELGTYISEVAILLRIFELVGQQTSYLGLTQVIFLVCMILGTLCGGSLGEGPRKLEVLLFCEVIRVPVVCLMLWGVDSPWTLMLGNGGVAFFSGVFNPTRQALINRMVPADLLPRANSLFAAAFALLHAFGPILGGLLFQQFGRLAPILWLDLFTYGAGIALLLALRPAVRALQESSDAGAGGGFWEDLHSGFGLVRKRVDFFWILLRCVFGSLALGVVIPLLLPFTVEFLGLSKSGYGWMLGLFGLGGAAGSLLLPGLLKQKPLEPLLRFLAVAEAASLIAWAFAARPAVSFLLAFAYGSLLFGRIAAQLDFVSLRLPPEFNARSNALLDLALVVPNVCGAALVALVGEHIAAPMLLRGTGLAALGFVLLVLVAERLSKRTA